MLWWSQIKIEGTEVREDLKVQILKDDKEKEATELSNSFDTTSWYFTNSRTSRLNYINELSALDTNIEMID